MIYDPEDGQTVATMSESATPEQAALLAAAPGLLEALKLAHKELTHVKNVMLSEVGNGVVDMNVLWKTEKAIQKVEGK